MAPVVEADASTRQYGDYVSQELSTADTAEGSDSTDLSDSSNSSDSSDSSTGSDSTDDSSSDASKTAGDSKNAAQAEAVDRLVSSLKLAKESGMHVVLMGNSIKGYKPDASSGSRMRKPSASCRPKKSYPSLNSARPVKTIPSTSKC